MKLSKQECPECESEVEHGGNVQENGDELVAVYTCNQCNCEFEVIFVEEETRIVEHGDTEEE